MEQIKFIFKRLTHLLIAVLAITSVAFGMLTASVNDDAAYEAKYKAFIDLSGQPVRLEIVEKAMNFSQDGYPSGIIAKVRNPSTYPIDASRLSCEYFVSWSAVETKVRNGVETTEAKHKPSSFMVHAADELYRIEGGQTVVLAFKANLTGGGIFKMTEALQRVKLGQCDASGRVSEFDAIRIIFQGQKP